jgi:RNA polymerase sigma factor (sigma-70 family)
MRNRSTVQTLETPRRSDRELIAACLKGDKDSWEEIISRYQRLVYSIPVKARLSPDDAADVFQTVCVRLLEGLHKLRDHDKLSSWLITTANRETWRIAARRRADLTTSRDDDEDGPQLDAIPDLEPLADQQREEIERQQTIREAVEGLPDRCREMIRLLFYGDGDFSYTDVAARLRMPVASIGPTRARCLEKLKRLLEGKL